VGAPTRALPPNLRSGGDWIIGDTPRDLETARAGGARCLLVATGRYPIDELAPLGADAVLPDLTDTALVVALVTGSSGG